MNEGEKVLQRILGAGARLENDPGKYVQHAREQYRQTREYFATVETTGAPPQARSSTGSSRDSSE